MMKIYKLSEWKTMLFILLQVSCNPLIAKDSSIPDDPLTDRITSGFYETVLRRSSFGNRTVFFTKRNPNRTSVIKQNPYLKINNTDYITVSAGANPPEICPGSTTQLIANAQGGVGQYTYSWSPETGLNDPFIRDPLASPTITTMYYISVGDEAGHTATDSVLVTILNVPSVPGNINGPDSTCSGSTLYYSVNTVPGATSYSWTVPEGASILEGQNTPSIEVEWGDTSGGISVIAGNICGNSNPSVKPVTMLGVPQTPVAIEGPDSICQNSTAQFFVEEITYATEYLWSVPPEVTILSGQNSRSIEVEWGPGAGEISVVSGNFCGFSNPQARFVKAGLLPGPAGMISGPDTVCANHADFLYYAGTIPGADSYFWELPTGAYITIGEGTDSIHVNFGPDAITGQLWVYGNNECGKGEGSSLTVIVKPCTGLEKIAGERFIQVYPNPAENFLNVTFFGNGKQPELSLLSMEGTILFSIYMEPDPKGYHKEIDLTAFRRGVYLLKIVSDNQFFTRKVILQ